MSDFNALIAQLSPKKREILLKRLNAQGQDELQASILPRPRTSNTFPLSFAQQRMWFLNQLEPDSAFYNISGALHITGDLCVRSLEQSINEVVKRHETLRTTFEPGEGQPVQIIAPFLHIPLPVLDVRECPESEVKKLINEEIDTPIDLVHGPLLHLTLLRLAQREHILVITVHHIIADGRQSMEIFFRELSICYNSLRAGKPVQLPKRAIQYVDYVLWQREYLQTKAFQTQLLYWKQQFKEMPSLLQLPTDHPRPATEGFRGATEYLVLPRTLTVALTELSQREGVTLFMVLLTAFYILLYRYSGQDDLVVGTPVDNRRQKGTDSLIGFFVDTLVLRARLSSADTFRDILQQIRAKLLDALTNQDVPFERLVEELKPKRSLSHNPLFQVMFSMQKALMTTLKVPDLKVELLDIEIKTALFDLELHIEETEEDLYTSIAYNTDLFECHTIRRMLTHFENILTGIVANPAERISHLPLLSKDQWHFLLVEQNKTQRNYPLEMCFHELFEKQVEEAPEVVAVGLQEHQVTYGELNQRAERLACHLQELGVGLETLVAVLSDRGIDLLTAIIAIFKAGGTYIPLDTHYPADRLHRILMQSHCTLLLVARPYLQTVEQGLLEMQLEDRPLCTSLEDLLCQQPRRHQETGSLLNRSTPDNLAYIIYTSGSTGLPKGAMIEQRGMLNHLYTKIETLQITNADSLAQTASQCFDISVWQFLAALLVGGRVQIYPDDVAHDPQQLLRAIEQDQVTILETVPSLLRLLIEEQENQQDSGLELKAVRWLVSTGESLPAELCPRWLNLYPAIPLMNVYGPTECSDDVTYYAINRSSRQVHRLVPIGNAVGNTQLYVLDRQIEPVPIGIVGELYVGGTGVGRGYLRDPLRTAEVFIPDPFSGVHGARLYKTGDLVRYLPDGCIEFLQRNDHQIKLRGYRIELGDIEAALNQHPAIRETVLTLYKETSGEPYLVAYVTLQGEQHPTAGDLRSFLQGKLPEYTIPATFVYLDTLPVTSNGKVDRHALPHPGKNRSQTNDVAVEPRSPLEEMLVEIWKQVLGLDRVGIHDDFFEVGGHSLLATQVISRVRDTFKVTLPLRSLFQAPTVVKLAEQIQKARLTDEEVLTVPLTPRPRTNPLPLSFAQQRLWFLDQLEPGKSHYNMATAQGLCGLLDTGALHQCLDQLVQRHEILRTTFANIHGQPVQVIAPFSSNCLHYFFELLDLGGIPKQEQEEAIPHLLSGCAYRPFGLTRGPLLRISLLRLHREEHILLVTMHHSIADGWSVQIFLEELAHLYNCHVIGTPPSLPYLPIQYADYALWQRECLQGETLELQLTYWKRQLTDAPPLLNLPTDKPRPAIQRFRGAGYFFTLSTSFAQALQALSRRQGVTLFMTLLAAFQLLLSRYSGQEDIVMGTPIANRTRASLESLVGLFVNSLALRTNLSGNPLFSELLKRVREVTLDAYAHQDLPFDKIVEVLHPERNLSYNPVFQVMFALQNISASHTSFSQLRSYPVNLENPTSQFDLTLVIWEIEDGLQIFFEYNTDLFEASTIERLARHWQQLLENIVADPNQRLSEYNFVSEAERHQLLARHNNLHIAYPHVQSLHQLFEQQVEQSRDVVAVVYEDGQLTYDELNRRANQLARYLQQQGVGPEVCVGICIERSLEMIIGILAILKAGGAYVPLDPVYPQERIATMLEGAQVSLVLTHAPLKAKLQAYDALVLSLDMNREVFARECDDNLFVAVQEDHMAFIVHTSGSTGKPKGAMLTHKSVGNRLLWGQEFYPFSPSDRVVQIASFSFDVSALEIFSALLFGSQLVLAHPGGQRDCAYLVRLINEQAVTVINFVPSLLQMFLKEQGVETCTSLRHVFCGGEALSGELRDRFMSMLPAALHNLYGNTETSIDATFHLCQKQNPPSFVPIGVSIANMDMYLLDRYLHLVPIGVRGELYIGGTGLARGYINHPELTAERFIPHPLSQQPGARLYKTGDMGRYFPNGDIECLGRLDTQVKLRGMRIELEEIETVLAQHTSVERAIVLLREDTPGIKRLVAYVECKQNAQFSALDLRRYLQQKLPDYMVPVIFIQMQSFPLTVNDKVDLRALPVPQREQAELTSNFALPLTSIEKTLSNIWAELFAVRQVGLHDNFFELGGDSILSLQLVSRAREAGLHFTVKQLFQYQTIGQLTSVVETAPVSQDNQQPVVGPVPLTPIQHWFFQQNWPNPHHFNQSVLLETRQPLNSEGLAWVMEHLLLHHDALRLRFTHDSAGWHQFNTGSEAAIPYAYFDLSAFSEEEQRRIIEETAAQLQASLHLETGPLLQIAYFDLGQNQPGRLLMIIHHVAIDGVSWRILLEDIQTAYQQWMNHQALHLPTKTTSFQQWSSHLCRYAQSAPLLQELDHWLAHIPRDISPLPVDKLDGINTVASARVISVFLNPWETQTLMQEVPKAYHTQINDALLTALIRAFAGWAGKRRLLVELEGHGREEIISGVNLSRTVGWFTTVFPVLLDLPETSDVGKTLMHIKEQLRCIPNKGLGYGVLRYLSSDQEKVELLQRLPQAQVAFNYLGQFDQNITGTSLFRLAKECNGPEVSPEGFRSHFLEINGSVIEGKLQLNWEYSQNIHSPATIQKLADFYVNELRLLIDHCRSLPSQRFTPSDFPKSRLNQQRLDKLIAKVSRTN